MGERGDDSLDGGGGNDTLIGGAGADRFSLSPGKDVISDFNPDQGDRIDIDPDIDLSIKQKGKHLHLLDDDNSMHTTLVNTSLDQLHDAHPDLA